MLNLNTKYEHLFCSQTTDWELLFYTIIFICLVLTCLLTQLRFMEALSNDTTNNAVFYAFHVALIGKNKNCHWVCLPCCYDWKENKLWEILPLHSHSHECCLTFQLTENFNSAKLFFIKTIFNWWILITYRMINYLLCSVQMWAVSWLLFA